jgi:LCP family protein required for cell wall assembly
MWRARRSPAARGRGAGGYGEMDEFSSSITSGDGAEEPEETTSVTAPQGTSKPRRFRRFRAAPRWARVLIVFGLVVAVLSGGTIAGAFWLLHRYESKVAHADLLGDAAPPPHQKRPPSAPLNLLLLGSDSRRGEVGKGNIAGERSDTIMLVHVSLAHGSAAVISIPRDSYVDIPAGGSWKGGKNKLNAALAFGGAPLAARTITQLTGIPLDGAVVVHFAGLRDMVDAVGGVTVCIDYDVRSSYIDKVWIKGCHQMNGADADAFTRERYNVPLGDIGREHQQQAVVQAILEKVSMTGMLTHPLEFDRLMTAAAQSLTIDRSMDLRQLALTVKDIKPANVKYATVPFSSLDLKTPAGSAVELNQAKDATLYDAIKSDTVDQWLAANPPDSRSTP